MTTHEPDEIRADDLRRLLDSDLEDATLILIDGHPEVASAGDQSRTGLEVISRRQFVEGAGTDSFSDDELQQHATQLTATVGSLGG
ncbi:hypothetical protein [Rhodococcus sp. NPDC058521]|uniref:hypothetical protein n=1 Tax=Rhodococcus sp. NPDC058521 TaxID=3346536 RepID=UPI0036668E2B